VPGLHSVDPADLAHEPVAVREDPRVRAAQQAGPGHVDGGREEVVAQDLPCDHREVEGGRVGLGGVQSHGVGEVGVLQAELLGAVVHLVDEPIQ